MKVTDGEISTKRGVTLFTRTYEPEDRAPSAVISFIHGFADYLSGDAGDSPEPTYYARAERWTSWGAACAGVEMEGHGRSAGTRGYVKDLNMFVDDAHEFLDSYVLKKWPNVPVFLFGESMGGAVAILLSLRPSLSKQVKGMVLFAPMVMIHPSMIPSPLVLKILWQLVKVVPKAKLLPGDAAKLVEKCYRDPSMRQRIKDDKLFYGDRQRLGTATAMLDATQYISEHVEDIVLPLLCLHGGSDTVTELEFSATLVKRASSADKELKTYEGVWHSMLSEKEWADQIYPDLFQWVQERTTVAA